MAPSPPVPSPQPALPPATHMPHTCRHSPSPFGKQTTGARRWMGNKAIRHRIWKKPGVESSLLNRVPAPAPLSHPLQGLSVPHSLALGPGSFHSEVLLGGQSSQGTAASVLPSPGPQVHSAESPAQLWPACGPLGPGVPRLCQQEVPIPASAHSSRLQLPGEAGQFPLVVDDLQLLDISPGAGWTPGAQGLLRAWGRGGAVREGTDTTLQSPILPPPRSKSAFLPSTAHLATCHCQS